MSISDMAATILLCSSGDVWQHAIVMLKTACPLPADQKADPLPVAIQVPVLAIKQGSFKTYSSRAGSTERSIEQQLALSVLSLTMLINFNLSLHSCSQPDQADWMV